MNTWVMGHLTLAQIQARTEKGKPKSAIKNNETNKKMTENIR